MDYWERIIKALAGLRAEQAIAVLVLLLPTGTTLWVLLRWAYLTRIENLKQLNDSLGQSLAELRADFQRKVQQAQENAKEKERYWREKAEKDLAELSKREQIRVRQLVELGDKIGPNTDKAELDKLLEHIRVTYVLPDRERKFVADARRRGIPIVRPIKPPEEEGFD